MIDEQRHNFGWDVASAVLHALFFLLLILFTPVRELVVPVRKPPPPAAEKLSAEKIERLDEMLAEARSRELLLDVEDLQTILNDMDVVRDQLRRDFDDVVEDLAPDAREQLREAAAEARRLQEEAIAKQEVATKTVDRLAEAEKQNLEESAKTIRDAANRLAWTEFMEVSYAQANAQNALDRIQTAAAFAGFEKIAEAASALRDAQIEAARLQSAEAKAIVEPARNLAEFDSAAAEKAAAETKAENERKAEAAELAKKEAAEADEKAAAQKRDEAEKRRADAERERNEGDQDRREAQKRMDAAKAERDRAEHARRDAERRVLDAGRRADAAAGRAKDQERRAANAQKRMDDLRDAAEKLDAEAQRERQRRANAAQRKVLDAMEKLDSAVKEDVAAPKSHVDEDAPVNEMALRDASGMSLSEAYEFARELEAAVTESYREVVAASTALTKRLPLEEAERLTDVAKPMREEFGKELLDGRARTAERLAARKEARYNAVREAENMVDASMAMMQEAFAIAGVGRDDELRRGGGRNGRRLRWMKRGDVPAHGADASRADRFIALAGLSDQLENAAAESDDAHAKDLSALTKPGGPAASGTKPPDDDFERVDGKTPEPRENGTPSKRGGDWRTGPGTGDDLLPGNVLSFDETASGRPGGWMFLDSWWVIGPFPNPDRVNITRKFPPESVIDLDAAYEGEGGLVRWEFVQARNCLSPGGKHLRAEVRPRNPREYAIWYGYTQLKVDRECDVWFAIGSDDRSDVWINGMKVWASGNNLKEWSIAEGFRKVHLSEGANQILVRLENGHGPTGFSICVSPHETPPPL